MIEQPTLFAERLDAYRHTHQHTVVHPEQAAWNAAPEWLGKTVIPTLSDPYSRDLLRLGMEGGRAPYDQHPA